MATKKTTEPVAQKGSTPSTSISLRGMEFEGVVTSAKATKTVTVSWERRRFIKKYERYEKRRSKVSAHNPPEIGAREGDVVRIKECRPISKTKHFVVTQIITRNEQ